MRKAATPQEILADEEAALAERARPAAEIREAQALGPELRARTSRTADAKAAEVELVADQELAEQPLQERQRAVAGRQRAALVAEVEELSK